MKIIFLDVDGVLDIFNREQYIQVLREDSLTNRSEEILDYLKRYSEIESYVILDDCFSDDYSQYPELQERLVFVDANQALQDCDVEKAMGILQDI